MRAFVDLGFPVGNQSEAERLADDKLLSGDFSSLDAYCRTAQVFQDVPFSWPETYRHLDHAWPGSKFILTVRDNPEQWYRSITRFHAKLFGANGQLPTVDDLKNATYVRRGFMYDALKVYGVSDADPYNEDLLIRSYMNHNRDAVEYFRSRPEQFLVLNVAQGGSYSRFLSFVGATSTNTDFPWENRT